MNVRMDGSKIAGKINVKDIHNSLPMGVIIIQQYAEHSELIDFNEYACRLLNATREQMHHLFSGEYSLFQEEIFQKNINLLVESGNKGSTDFICPCEDMNGKKIWLRMLCTSCEDCGTAIIYAAILDVTEEISFKHAEQFELEKCRLYYETSDVDIFEYNIAENTLHVWGYEHGIEIKRYVIQNFREQIFSNRVLHPDDKQKCYNFFSFFDQDEKSGVFEVRMQLQERGYRWHRIYFKRICDELEQAKLIFGRAEDIQKIKDDENALVAKSKIEALYRHSISEQAVLSIEFDLTFGKRIVTEYDVIPSWLPENSFYDTGIVIRNQIIHPDDRECVDKLARQFDEKAAIHNNPVAMHCECRIRYVFSDKLDYHWCRICILVARNEANGHRHLFLSVINIDREKEADYERWSIVNTDPSTGLLTRLAFEKRISVWTSKNRLERDPMLMPVLAVTVIAIDEMNHAESMIDDSMEATSVVSAAQSIKAFVRPDEISCRYGPNEFAIVLKDAGDDTLLKERLHMLYSALVSKLEGDADAVINIGYVILDCEADFKVQALKKAQYAMNLARKKEKNRCVQFSESIKLERLKMGKDSDQNIEESGNDICVCAIGEKQVFIRTCGAFDVFADEKAILFSHAKSKELLALLVDRRGGYVAAKEAIAKLWEDDIPYSTKMNRYRKASMFLKETLSEHGVEYILETFKKKRRINTASIDCDCYQFVSDEWTTAQFIPNSYLPEYSWAESSIAFLEAIRRQRHQTAKT